MGLIQKAQEFSDKKLKEKYSLDEITKRLSQIGVDIGQLSEDDHLLLAHFFNKAGAAYDARIAKSYPFMAELLADKIELQNWLILEQLHKMNENLEALTKALAKEEPPAGE